MNSDLGELYQQLILDHNRRPHHFGMPPSHTHQAEGYNPLCGDKLTIYVTLQDNAISAVHFDGQSCAIAKASASLMSQQLSGKSLQAAETLFAQFHAMLTAATPEACGDDLTALGKLAAFRGVREFPMRVKCATLAWHTWRAALQQSTAPVNTEAFTEAFGEPVHG